ncbi:MAG TPA: FIST N-terminal domain-containing protein, partial [Capillimicrobium sp.]|nr:FIST N-terminal domain-containing protein [Capillimicrobium sp.]
MGIDAQAPALPEAGRWLGVGHAADPDPGAAAARAVEAALGGRDDAQLVLAFADPGYAAPALAEALAAAADGCPVAGCTTAGELTAEGAHTGSLVVAALGGPGFAVSTVVVPHARDDLRGAGAEAAAALGDVADRPHRILLLLADGLAGDGEELVRGAYSVAGAGVPLVGACAGDGERMRATGQLHDGVAHTGALVAAAIGSDAPLGIDVRHGWRSIGEPLHVTRTDGPTIIGLDDRPALDVYLERLDAPEDVRDDPAAFARFALDRPVGLRRKAGEERVRLVVGADFTRRTVRTAAEVPQGGLAWLMTGDAAATRVAGERACADAVAALGGAAPLGLLAFGAAARRRGDDAAALRRRLDRLCWIPAVVTGVAAVVLAVLLVV